MQRITISTDGSCIGNPGPGGFAGIIQCGRDESIVYGGDPKTTNNRMELSAVVESLWAVNNILTYTDAAVTVRSDSQYVTKAFTAGWLEGWKRRGWRNSKKQPVPNRDLWEGLLHELEGHEVRWVWVRGHAGDSMNERCDRLALEQARWAARAPDYWVSTRPTDRSC